MAATCDERHTIEYRIFIIFVSCTMIFFHVLYVTSCYYRLYTFHKEISQVHRTIFIPIILYLILRIFQSQIVKSINVYIISSIFGLYFMKYIIYLFEVPLRSIIDV